MTAPPARSTTEYLEALYEMDEEGIPTVQARLAEWMGVSRASVSEAVKRLLRDGLVRSEDRRLAFTENGERLAVAQVRRHRIAEHFLIRIIGLPWHRAHEEAGRWERAISDEVEARMVEILGDPGACPHGNPIPGSANAVDLAGLRRLTEDLELDLDVMRFFEDSGLMPGARIDVRRKGPDGTMGLEVDGEAVAVGAHLADNLWVAPLGDRRIPGQESGST